MTNYSTVYYENISILFQNSKYLPVASYKFGIPKSDDSVQAQPRTYVFEHFTLVGILFSTLVKILYYTIEGEMNVLILFC